MALALIRLHEPYVAPALAGTAVAALWLTEFRWGRLVAILRPAAYGVTLALVMLETHPFFAKWWLGLFMGRARPQDTLIAPWVSEIVAGAPLVAAAGCLLARAGDGLRRPRALAALAAAAAVGALSVEAPGIATGLMIVLLGYAAANRVLAGIGLAALVFYLSAYYYTLEETLLYKSAVLAATGLVPRPGGHHRHLEDAVAITGAMAGIEGTPTIVKERRRRSLLESWLGDVGETVAGLRRELLGMPALSYRYTAP